jgi:group I intron endonuclease
LTGFILLFCIPVLSYANPDTQKESILNDNKSKAGVYCWTNIESGKKYVGSSVDLYRRFMQYYNIKYITRASKSSLICKALLKYGYSSFTLEILEYCEISDLIKREQYYIDTLKPEYNILKVAGSLFGYKHTIESIQKMSEIASNRSEETIAKLREAALGKTYKHTEETKNKISENMLGYKHTQETKQKLKLIQSNRTKHPVKGISIQIKDTLTGKITFYDSLRNAGIALNSSHRSMKNNLDNAKLFRKRYIITSIKNEA